MDARGALSTSVSPEKFCHVPACLLLRVCPYYTWKLDGWGKHALQENSSASSTSHLTRAKADWHSLLAQGEEPKEDEEFAIVFAAMGVNMETAHFFKQVSLPPAHHFRAPSHLPLHLNLMPGPASLTGCTARRTLRRTAPWTRRCCS